ncbi:MAG: hypothetical protein DCF15_21410 [Phormidesmis priestleyi]|uniref:PatU n=1 Tax=Phormidesmis priestleyi TaxID=268141 RepID=A0A2W4WMH1_9CYAN|nr:MAG: hypothetical protein DCF15_21410 [Phormidesmis priestleyi]
MKPTYLKGFEVSSMELSADPSTSASALPSGVLGARFSEASRDMFLHDIVSQTAQSYNFGEIHAVQERFEALLKQRLLLEYEKNPPLFPWESEVGEYPAEVNDFAAVTAAPSLWNAHVSKLKVSGLLPEDLLNHLFERCQAIACSPMKQGVQLVRAVEALFPAQADLLEPIANMVLVPAYRSDRATQDAVAQELVNVAGGYDSALPAQQIALSMMAAREILGVLTLCVGNQQPSEKTRWITPRGVLELTASYQSSPSANHQASQLTITAVLPDGGELRLWDGDMEKRSRRAAPGGLDIVWTQPTANKTYGLEISLEGEAQPLTFAVQIAADCSTERVYG